MKNTDKKIVGDYPPVIVETPAGTWAVTGSCWIKISPTTTLEEVRALWEKPVNSITAAEIMADIDSTIIEDATYPVTGSSGNLYHVRYTNGRWSCECTGFSYRGICKHITQIKNSKK